MHWHVSQKENLIPQSECLFPSATLIILDQIIIIMNDTCLDISESAKKLTKMQNIQKTIADYKLLIVIYYFYVLETESNQKIIT